MGREEERPWERGCIKCGTSQDNTNIDSGIPTNDAAAFSEYTELDKGCYGKTKEMLLLLQEAIKEGEACSKGASDMQNRLETMCTYLQPLQGFSAKFEKVLKLLKLIHRALDKGTKFANNIPTIGKLRKIIVEKVMPAVLSALETLHQQVSKAIEYMEKFLGYKDKKKGFKLLWEVDKKGAMICKLTSPAGKSLKLLNSTVHAVNKPSKVLLQAVNETQVCMTSYCHTRGGGSGCSECSVIDSNIAKTIPNINTWKNHMTTCSKSLAKGNQAIDKIGLVMKVFQQVAESILDETEKFLKPIKDQLEKFAAALGPVMKNLMSCCPCGRPNPVGCVVQTVTKVVDLVSCPLDGITLVLVNNLLNNFRNYVTRLMANVLPKIDVKISIPAVGFEIEVPKYLQDCFKKSYGKPFTKLCSLPGKSLEIRLGTSFTSVNSPSFTKRSTSLSFLIKQSCSQALGAFKKFGKEMSTCFDSVDDVFFAIPPIGAIAALTCDPNYSDPDPGINYCPCLSSEDSVTQKTQKQPYCVVWDRSALQRCSSRCREKKYSPGKNPSGGSGAMHKTFGYPYCDRLAYYCRVANIEVKHGRVECSNEYIFLKSTCKVIPDAGYVCPVKSIECGSISSIKGVCWNYPYIECSKNDGNHFPMCTCRNRDTFQKGEMVCQLGSTTTDTQESVKEMRKSFSCFKPLGLEQDAHKDCGAQMYPCVIQTPNVEAFHRCRLERHEKFWAAHGDKFAIAGGLVIAATILFLMCALVIACKNEPDLKTTCGAVLCAVLPLAAGIAMLVCGLVFKTPDNDADNYLKLGEVV